MMGFIISCASVVIFTGLTAYDTQKLRAIAASGAGVAALPITGALMLYLDFINLFLACCVFSAVGGLERISQPLPAPNSARAAGERAEFGSFRPGLFMRETVWTSTFQLWNVL
jgi:hypothetical protein